MGSENTIGIPLCKISPDFLHSNSTSHTWVFSAIAEIIDNAYDPDVRATDLSIDKEDIGGNTCLVFQDDGIGMLKDDLLRMLSLGFCEKAKYETGNTHQPIGQYGNGFKSGSMRIGSDALVLTLFGEIASIGFLSQTYLKAIGSESVIVPILEYHLPKLEHDGSQESLNNLNAILTHSVFNSEDKLKDQLRSLLQSRKTTKIIISNLKRMDDGELELDFSSDEKDIRCCEADLTATGQATSKYRTSLRAYCSILFLRPGMKITIRRQRVKRNIISESLGHRMRDSYKPGNSERKNAVDITFGFSCEKGRDESYGMMLYYRNRLIKPFVHVGCQKQPDDRGVGVVGVVDADFLQPTHIKQDFNQDTKYNSAMKAFAAKLNNYVDIVMGETDTSSSAQPNSFVQCDRCLKWRRLPDTVDKDTLPEKWYCRNNPNINYNRCHIPEETDDEAEVPKIKAVKKDQKQQKGQQQTLEKEAEKKKKDKENTSSHPPTPTKKHLKRKAEGETLQKNASKKQAIVEDKGNNVATISDQHDDDDDDDDDDDGDDEASEQDSPRKTRSKSKSSTREEMEESVDMEDGDNNPEPGPSKETRSKSKTSSGKEAQESVDRSHKLGDESGPSKETRSKSKTSCGKEAQESVDCSNKLGDEPGPSKETRSKSKTSAGKEAQESADRSNKLGDEPGPSRKNRSKSKISTKKQMNVGYNDDTTKQSPFRGAHSKLGSTSRASLAAITGRVGENLRCYVPIVSQDKADSSGYSNKAYDKNVSDMNAASVGNTDSGRTAENQTSGSGGESIERQKEGSAQVNANTDTGRSAENQTNGSGGESLERQEGGSAQVNANTGNVQIAENQTSASGGESLEQQEEGSAQVNANADRGRSAENQTVGSGGESLERQREGSAQVNANTGNVRIAENQTVGSGGESLERQEEGSAQVNANAGNVQIAENQTSGSGGESLERQKEGLAQVNANTDSGRTAENQTSGSGGENLERQEEGSAQVNANTDSGRTAVNQTSGSGGENLERQEEGSAQVNANTERGRTAENQTSGSGGESLERQEEGSAQVNANTELHENAQSRHEKFKSNVYKLLQLLVPDYDLGDIANIEQLVENMIKRNEQDGHLESLPEDPQVA